MSWTAELMDDLMKRRGLAVEALKSAWIRFDTDLGHWFDDDVRSVTPEDTDKHQTKRDDLCPMHQLQFLVWDIIPIPTFENRGIVTVPHRMLSCGHKASYVQRSGSRGHAFPNAWMYEVWVNGPMERPTFSVVGDADEAICTAEDKLASDICRELALRITTMTACTTCHWNGIGRWAKRRARAWNEYCAALPGATAAVFVSTHLLPPPLVEIINVYLLYGGYPCRRDGCKRPPAAKRIRLDPKCAN